MFVRKPKPHVRTYVDAHMSIHPLKSFSFPFPFALAFFFFFFFPDPVSCKGTSWLGGAGRGVTKPFTDFGNDEIGTFTETGIACEG